MVGSDRAAETYEGIRRRGVHHYDMDIVELATSWMELKGLLCLLHNLRYVVEGNITVICKVV